MDKSTVPNKVNSILENQPQEQFAETLNNYSQYRSEKITPDLLEMVWNRATDGMLLTDSDGIIVSVNDAFCTMVHMKENELLRLPFTVIYDHSVDRTKIFEEYRYNIRNNSFDTKIEKHLQLNSGKNIHAELLTSPLIDEAEELYILTEFRDISERKRWEYSLNQSEHRYRSLFENSVLPMYESNIDGRVTNANVAFLQLLGYDTFNELRRLNLERDVYADAKQRVKLFEKLLIGIDTKPSELDLKKKDGTIITVLAHSRILKDEYGVFSGFEGALEDITERKKMEQQIQSNIQKLEATQEELTKLNTQKDKILGIVSHDLRSPFSSILGFCDLLKSEFHTLSDNEKLEYIGFVNDAAIQQLNLVNSMLDWSRLETGRFRLKFQPVNVGTIASETMTTLLGLAKKKNIELRSSIPPDTRISADEQLLRQLLSNLVGNALKFTPAGGMITIDLAKNSDSETSLEISDTGIGIPAEDLEKIFKIEEKYSRQGLQGESGTGLGLPMCYEIMKKHGGSIEVKSEEGIGTTFTVTFQKQARTVCKKVLIVDDEKGNRLLLSRFMKRISEGSETIFAQTGKEALDMMLAEEPDLVLTDYNMPLMDGLEFIRNVRSNEYLKHTPIILISGANMDYYTETDALTKLIQKPIVYDTLKEVIEKMRL